MHVIEILLPAYEEEQIALVRRELTKKFGGVTAFVRSPAKGEVKQGQSVVVDDIVVVEVMTKDLDRPWWQSYRETLEHRFKQDEIVVRATNAEIL